MAIKTEKFTISTKGFDDIIDISSKVKDIVDGVDAASAVVNVFVVASCASLVLIEDELGLTLDLPRFLDGLVPINKVYQHDNLWHNGNAHAHLKASLLGNSISLAVIDKRIQMDTWQKIALIDFDNKPRIRQVIVSVTY